MMASFSAGGIPNCNHSNIAALIFFEERQRGDDRRRSTYKLKLILAASIGKHLTGEQKRIFLYGVTSILEEILPKNDAD